MLCGYQIRSCQIDIVKERNEKKRQIKKETENWKSRKTKKTEEFRRNLKNFEELRKEWKRFEKKSNKNLKQKIGKKQINSEPEISSKDSKMKIKIFKTNEKPKKNGKSREKQK